VTAISTDVETVYVVLKTVEACNLACPYCYFFFKGDESFEKHPRIIPQSVVAATADFLLEGVNLLSLKRVCLSFHGGEPLLMPKHMFEAMCARFLGVLSPYVTVEFSIQTNGTLIDWEWLELLSMYEVGIGVSLDGPKFIHDRNRPAKANEQGSYDQVCAAIRMLQKAERDGLIPGFAVNSVISDGCTAELYLAHMVDELGLRSLDVIAPSMDWDCFDREQAEHVRKFYDDLVRLWLQRGDPTLQIGTFGSAMGTLLTDRGMNEREASLHNGVPTFTVRSDGTIGPDDALAPKSPEFSDTRCNVKGTGFAEFFEQPFWTKVAENYSSPQTPCQSCKFVRACGGGLQEHRHSSTDGFKRNSVYCSSHLAMYNGIYSYLVEHIDPHSIDLRLAGAA
jgi:uncharacterized protein